MPTHQTISTKKSQISRLKIYIRTAYRDRYGIDYQWQGGDATVVSRLLSQHKPKVLRSLVDEVLSEAKEPHEYNSRRTVDVLAMKADLLISKDGEGK